MLLYDIIYFNNPQSAAVAANYRSSSGLLLGDTKLNLINLRFFFGKMVKS